MKWRISRVTESALIGDGEGGFTDPIDLVLRSIEDPLSDHYILFDKVAIQEFNVKSDGTFEMVDVKENDI